MDQHVAIGMATERSVTTRLKYLGSHIVLLRPGRLGRLVQQPDGGGPGPGPAGIPRAGGGGFGAERDLRPDQHDVLRSDACFGSTFRPKPGWLECLQKLQDNIMLNNKLSQLS